MRGADAKRARPVVILPVGACECQRNQIGENQIGLFIHEKAGRQVHRVPRLFGALGARPLCRAIAPAGHHGAGELVDFNARVRNDALAIWRNASVPVDEPTLFVGVVVPKIETRSRRLVERVRIDQPGAFRAVCAGDGNITTAGLNREVDGDCNARRQWKRRLPDGNRRDADLGCGLAVDVGDGRVRRNVEFQPGKPWCCHDDLGRCGKWNVDGVRRVERRHPDRIVQNRHLTPSQIHAHLEHPVRFAGTTNCPAVDHHLMVARRNSCQQKSARSVGFGALLIDADRHAFQGFAVERQCLTRQGRHTRRRLQRRQIACGGVCRAVRCCRMSGRCVIFLCVLFVEGREREVGLRKVRALRIL